MDSTSILYSKNSPVTFLEWLESQERVSPDYSVNFKLYQEYINNWVGIENNKAQDSRNFFARLYIDLLREITLNFSTEEEKRFIVNFDFNKTDNLDIIIPFFIDKLKDICIFYSSKRESLKDTISQIPIKGTNLSVKKLVKSIILNEIENKNVQKESEGRITFPSLSAINRNLEIKIEELYDTSNYYDPEPSEIKSELDNFDDIEIDKDLYLNFKESIKNAIREYPLFIESLLGNFSINYTLSGDELDLLKERDFISYVKTLSSEDLKLNFKKRLAPKYLSTDFYYLSVGNTLEETLSGLLFTTKPLTGSNIQNLTNRYESRVASVQKLDNLYTAYELGKFFIPNQTGVLQYNAFNKKFYINFNKLTPNTTYVFPDPTVIEGKDSPVVYKVNVNWNRIGPEGGFSFGNVISDSHYQRFYPYESYSQDVASSPLGLSLQKDNIDFWTGDKSNIWTEKELWPGLDEVDRLPLQTRIESLLLDKGTLTDWYTDLYGNQFGLYKNIDSSTSLYDKKKVMPGTLYVKNTVTNLVSTFNHFFNRVFFKYPENIFKELTEEPFISFYLIKNIFVIETKTHVVIDSYECDLETGKFINTLLPGIYIPKYEINQNLEKFLNSYYVESKNKLYLCFLKLLPSLSATNYKSLIPTIYELDIDNLNFVQKYPGLKLEASYYSLSSKDFKEFPEIDLRYIEGGKFLFKERFDLFNLTYYAFNLNNIPYIVNEQFTIEEGNNYLNSFGSLLHKPYLYVHDVNFSNPTVDHTLRYSASYSELVGSKDVIKFKWEIPDDKGDNSYFCSNINPVIINRPGSHYVQFDWDKYVLGNVFIGCEAITVANIDEKNVVGFRDGTPSIVLDQEDKVYKIRDYNFFGYNFSLSASRPYNTSNGIIHFTISSDTPGFSGNFCNNLYSIYRKVFVNIIGDGVGAVYGDPACLDCPPICEFVYPLYSTITLIPSANPRSVFAGWRGSPCEGLASNCTITVTDNTSVSAVFNKIPFYKLNVTTNLPGTTITTTDGNIFCGDVCEYEYQEGTLVGLSAGPSRIGKAFETFKGGPLCGVNNPCGITMTNNFYITAIYVDAFQDLEIYKEYLNLEYGPILARTLSGTRSLFLPSADRAFFYSKNVSGMIGNITCSLSAETPIYAYAQFLSTPRSTFISNTGRGGGDYIFGGWKGSPCNGSPSNICSFPITRNYSVTGFVTVPTYTFTVVSSGDGVFYVESEDGKINCGTRGFINTKRDCFDTYLSGTFIYLSGVCAPGSKLYALCATKQYENIRDLNNIIGEDQLELGLYITENIILTAVGAGLDKRTLTVIKSGSDKAFESAVLVKVVGFKEFLIDKFVEREIFELPVNSSIEIYPFLDANFHRHLYTIGFSGLYYKYDTIGFTLNPQITATLPIFDFITPTNAVFNVESQGAPYYDVLGGGSPITINNRESYLTLNASATAIVVYQEIEFIAKQENEDDPVYTEDQLYIYTK